MNKLNNEIQNFIVNSNVMDEESRKKMSNIYSTISTISITMV